MAMVPFAAKCDAAVTMITGEKGVCGKRSAEYTSWPTCRECHEHVCPEHMRPGTDDSDDHGYTCICASCGKDE